MTDDRTLERAARSWLEEGPTRAPDRAVDAALSRIESIRQERDLRIAWRLRTMLNNRLVAAAVAVVVLIGAGFALTRFSGIGGPSTAPSSTPAVTSAPTVVPPTTLPSGAAAKWHGQILVEHLGNAPDGSENAPDGSVPLHRFYLVDPNNQTATGYTEFLPGQPTAGKSSADVSLDGTKVVFQDWADPSSIYIANLDGTGFRKLTADGCGCSEWDPAFNPSASKVVYGHAEGDKAWLEILDLATGQRGKVVGTEGSALDNVVESPSWSRDGAQIVFVRTTWNGQPSNMGLVHYDSNQTPGGASMTFLSLLGLPTTTYRTGDANIGPHIPGDPFFTPDGGTVLFTDRTFTKMPNLPLGAYTMRIDGAGLTRVVDAVDAATLTPDGEWVVSTDNFFKLTHVDGSAGGGLVDVLATDNTEGNVGFIYVGHWVGNP